MVSVSVPPSLRFSYWYSLGFCGIVRISFSRSYSKKSPVNLYELAESPAITSPIAVARLCFLRYMPLFAWIKPEGCVNKKPPSQFTTSASLFQVARWVRNCTLSCTKNTRPSSNREPRLRATARLSACFMISGDDCANAPTGKSNASASRMAKTRSSRQRCPNVCIIRASLPAGAFPHSGLRQVLLEVQASRQYLP